MLDLASYIRAIADFPEPGIVFRDITPLLKNPAALGQATAAMAAPFAGQNVSTVVGMEARGFIFGALVARELNAGFVPLRKPGKLPHAVRGVNYALEYGEASLEIHADALGAGEKVLLIDDVIATGGTAAASCELVSQFGVDIVGFGFLIELEGLGGRQRLPDCPVESLLVF